jgi:hypothetical protein
MGAILPLWPRAGEKSETLGRRKSVRAVFLTAALAVAAIALAPLPSRADEGGVSFWVPGFFGSLAAVPQQPGLSFASIYYHTSVTAGGNVAFARQVARGNIMTNFTGNLNANLDADANLLMAIPSYTFAQPLLGGQATVAMLVPTGRTTASVDATLTGNLGLGGPGFTISGGRSDETSGFGDLVPQFNLRWNAGVHNFMTYVTGNITVGAYDKTSLANLGIGHNAIDGGSATPTSIRPRDTSFPRSRASPTISRTITPSTRTASTFISTGEPRSSCPNSFSSAWSAISTSRSVATAVPATGSAVSSRACSASARRSDISSRLASGRDT